MEDCGINLSKLLNADYTVDLSIINDLEFIFEVKSKDNRRIQYYKSQISDYNDYRFSFRDCIRNADCLHTASPILESETKKGVFNRPKVLLFSSESYQSRHLRKHLSEDYDIISEEVINEVLKKMKCENYFHCGGKLIKLFNPDYHIRVERSGSIQLTNKEWTILFSGNKNKADLLFYLYWFRDCLKNGNCEKLQRADL